MFPCDNMEEFLLGRAFQLNNEYSDILIPLASQEDGSNFTAALETVVSG